jgi:hypothetical protein
MTTDALKALFALLDTKDDDFTTLVKRFDIDPAKDLQNCDLSNVDFGKFTADTLDLTGSIITGANLSQVTCNKFIGVGGSAPEGKEAKNVWDDVLLAIARYQNSDWVLNRIIETSKDSPDPILAFYDSPAQQAILTKRICVHYGDASHVREGFSMHAFGIKLLWFYSKASKGPFRLNPASLDKAFFEALRTSNTSDDIGIYPLRPNQAAVERIRNSVRSRTYDRMRTEFSRSLRSELMTQGSQELAIDHGSVVIFSGFPPISKRLYRDIREAGQQKLSLIFLCSSDVEPYYTQNNGKPWRRVAMPASPIGEPLTVAADIGRLSRRIEVASGRRITLSKSMEQWTAQFVGTPITTLKVQLAIELKAALATKRLGKAARPKSNRPRRSARTAKQPS